MNKSPKNALTEWIFTLVISSSCSRLMSAISSLCSWIHGVDTDAVLVLPLQQSHDDRSSKRNTKSPFSLLEEIDDEHI